MKLKSVRKAIVLSGIMTGVGAFAFSVGAVCGALAVMVITTRADEAAKEKLGEEKKTSDRLYKTAMQNVSGHVEWVGEMPNKQKIKAVEIASEMIARHLGLVYEDDMINADIKFGIVKYSTASYGWSVVMEQLFENPSGTGPKYRVIHHLDDHSTRLVDVDTETLLAEDKTPLSSAETLLARYKEGRTIAEIASHFEMTQEKVKSLLKGAISNSITDMTIGGATKEQIEREVGFSMKIMDEPIVVTNGEETTEDWRKRRVGELAAMGFTEMEIADEVGIKVGDVLRITAELSDETVREDERRSKVMAGAEYEVFKFIIDNNLSDRTRAEIEASLGLVRLIPDGDGPGWTAYIKDANAAFNKDNWFRVTENGPDSVRVTELGPNFNATEIYREVIAEKVEKLRDDKE